jgi:hypothetical protein
MPLTATAEGATYAPGMEDIQGGGIRSISGASSLGNV